MRFSPIHPALPLLFCLILRVVAGDPLAGVLPSDAQFEQRSPYGFAPNGTGDNALLKTDLRRDETVQFLRWLVARKVKRWIRRSNLEAKHTGRPRLLVWALPKRSPWLTPIELHWMHAKKRICEPSNNDLTPHQLRRRVFHALSAKFVAALSQPHLC